MPLIELFGYFGSALIATSLMMTNIVRLRIVNLIGASLFASYGLIIAAWPVAALNSFIVSINIVHLIFIYRRSKQHQHLTLTANDPYLTQVLSPQWPELSALEKDQEVVVTFNQLTPISYTIK